MTAPAVAVFGSSRTQPGSHEWSEAEAVGSGLAASGFAVITGGYGGVMEAASKGAVEAGGHAIGVTANVLFPGRSGANHYVSEEIGTTSLAERIGTLISRSSAAIAMPGSIGTAAELLIAWNVNDIAGRSNENMLPTVAVGSEWQQVSALLAAEIGADPGAIHNVNTGTEAVVWIRGQLERD